MYVIALNCFLTQTAPHLFIACVVKDKIHSGDPHTHSYEQHSNFQPGPQFGQSHTTASYRKTLYCLIGINRDLTDHKLPPEIWTEARNIRFEDNKAIKFLGHTPVFDPPTIPPYWALAIPTATSHFWLYAGQDDVYTVTGGVHTKITRASGVYTGGLTNLWDGGVLGGIPVINNGVDVPQAWNPVAAGQVLVDLPNWPAATVAQVVKPFKQFLVALNTVESGTEFPHKVRWSDSASIGALPGSWDVFDATTDAGDTELTDHQAGILLDCAVLGDILAIYKENSIWGMQFVGGGFIFRFIKLFPATGLLSKRALAVLPGAPARHLVMTGDDVVIHDGASMESVLDKRMRKYLNSTLDSTNYANSFCTLVPRKREVWICFPENGAILPTRAIVWNYEDGTLGDRDLSEAAFIASGVVSETVDETWDADSQAWDLDASTWNERTFVPYQLDVMQCDPTNTKLYHLDRTNQFNGVNMTVQLERTGLAIIGQDRTGKIQVDIQRRKLITRLWIRATGDPFSVRIGSQELIGGPVTYEAPKVFTPGVDEYLDFCTSGKLIAIRFESNADVNWELEEYELEVTPLGKH